jgi:hypothetical protein
MKPLISIRSCGKSQSILRSSLFQKRTALQTEFSVMLLLCLKKYCFYFTTFRVSTLPFLLVTVMMYKPLVNSDVGKT